MRSNIMNDPSMREGMRSLSELLRYFRFTDKHERYIPLNQFPFLLKRFAVSDKCHSSDRLGHCKVIIGLWP